MCHSGGRARSQLPSRTPIRLGNRLVLLNVNWPAKLHRFALPHLLHTSCFSLHRHACIPHNLCAGDISTKISCFMLPSGVEPCPSLLWCSVETRGDKRRDGQKQSRKDSRVAVKSGACPQSGTPLLGREIGPVITMGRTGQRAAGVFAKGISQRHSLCTYVLRIPAMERNPRSLSSSSGFWSNPFELGLRKERHLRKRTLPSSKRAF